MTGGLTNISYILCIPEPFLGKFIHVLLFVLFYILLTTNMMTPILFHQFSGTKFKCVTDPAIGCTFLALEIQWGKDSIGVQFAVGW